MQILIITLGAVFGSFLDLCIHRLPRRESLVTPRSHCSSCGHQLCWRDLIPIFSFIALRGRCRYCRHPFGNYHLLVEVLTPVLGLFLFEKQGLTGEFLVESLFAGTLLIIAFTDWREYCIPNVAIVVALLAAVLRQLSHEPFSLTSPLIGLTASAALLWIPARLTNAITGRASLGAGDLKLAMVLGLYLGWRGAVLVIWLACVLGALVGVVGFSMRRLQSHSKIPFGFFLSGITLLYLILETKVGEWWAS